MVCHKRIQMGSDDRGSYKQNPPAPGPRSSLSGIGGWLVLVAIGLALSPFYQLRTIALVIVPHLKGPPSPVRDYYVYLLVVEAVTLPVALYLNVLLYLKDRRFPLCMIVFAMLSFVFTLVGDVAFVAQRGGGGLHLDSRVTQTFIYMAVWVPYLLLSRRGEVYLYSVAPVLTDSSWEQDRPRTSGQGPQERPELTPSSIRLRDEQSLALADFTALGVPRQARDFEALRPRLGQVRSRAMHRVGGASLRPVR